MTGVDGASPAPSWTTQVTEMSTSDSGWYQTSTFAVDNTLTGRLLAAGVPANTQRARSVGRRSWLAWTARTKAPPLPPAAGDLAEYAAFLLTVGSPLQNLPRPLSPGTVEAYLSSVSSWAVSERHPRPDLTAARLVLRGHQRTAPSRPLAKAAPVTLSVLRQLVDTAMLSCAGDGSPTLRALRNRALLLLGFSVAARRSELVAIDLSQLHRVPEGLMVEVWSIKTRTRSDLIAVPFAREVLALCPVRATTALVTALDDRGVRAGPLFRPVTRTDVVLPRRLGPKSVTDIVSSLARAAAIAVPDGFAGWSSHSLRRGAATEMRRAGADPLTIARQGRWQDGSKALAGYLEDLDKWVDHPLRRMI